MHPKEISCIRVCQQCQFQRNRRMWAWCSPLHSPAPKHLISSVSLSLPAISLHPIRAPSSPPPLLDRTGSHAAAGHRRNATGGCHENPHLWGTSTDTKAIDAREVDQGKRTLFSHPSSLFPPQPSCKASLENRAYASPIMSHNIRMSHNLVQFPELGLFYLLKRPSVVHSILVRARHLSIQCLVFKLMDLQVASASAYRSPVAWYREGWCRGADQNVGFKEQVRI